MAPRERCGKARRPMAKRSRPPKPRATTSCRRESRWELYRAAMETPNRPSPHSTSSRLTILCMEPSRDTRWTIWFMASLLGLVAADAVLARHGEGDAAFGRQHRGQHARRLHHAAAEAVRGVATQQHQAVGTDQDHAAATQRDAAEQAQFGAGLHFGPVLAKVLGFEGMAAQAEGQEVLTFEAEHAEHRAVVGPFHRRPGAALVA